MKLKLEPSQTLDDALTRFDKAMKFFIAAGIAFIIALGVFVGVVVSHAH